MKSIQKSIRISDEVYDIVMKQPGQGFSEKFENLVLKYSYAEKNLDSRLNSKQQELQRYTDRINEKSKLLGDLDRIKFCVQDMLRKCNTI